MSSDAKTDMTQPNSLLGAPLFPNGTSGSSSSGASLSMSSDAKTSYTQPRGIIGGPLVSDNFSFTTFSNGDAKTELSTAVDQPSTFDSKADQLSNFAGSVATNFTQFGQPFTAEAKSEDSPRSQSKLGEFSIGESKDTKLDGMETKECKVEYKRWNQDVIESNKLLLNQQRQAEEKNGEFMEPQEKPGGVAYEEGDDDDDDDDEEWDSEDDEDDEEDDEDEDGTLGGMTMSAGLMRMLGMDVPDEEPVESDWVPPSHAGLDNSTRLM